MIGSVENCSWESKSSCPFGPWTLSILSLPLAKISRAMWGRCGSGGRAVVWQSEGCRFEVSLSKTPNPQLLLTSWLKPCMAANRRWCVNVCVNGWMRGKNCKALWIKALYKCSPFTIYHSYPCLCSRDLSPCIAPLVISTFACTRLWFLPAPLNKSLFTPTTLCIWVLPNTPHHES